MRPAGMSSDEDDDDDYFSMNLISKKRDRDSKQQNIMECLPQNQSDGIRSLLDHASKSSLFHRAAQEADFVLMEELIEKDVSVDDSKVSEWTPLMKACSDGKHEVVNFLLEKGANPNLHKELFTPLMACCTPSYIPETDRLECVRLLIQFGAQINATDKHKTTALMLASANGWSEIVNELLASPDIDINMTDKEGWSALFHAVNYNNKSIVERLITAGIDLNLMNKHGEYGAIQLADMKNYKEILKILREANGEVITDDNRIFRCTVVFDEIVRNSLREFREQFPYENGNGGFSTDVRTIFAGIGLEKMYDKLKIDVSFPDFLVMTNLSEIGVKFQPVKLKIRKGIHRYHLVPWKKSSLYPVRDKKDLQMDDYIQAVSHLTKHLVIMYATLNYVRNRISCWEGKTYASFDREIMDLLTGCYVEIQKTKRLIKNISAISAKIKSGGEVEADFVGEKGNCDPNCKKWWKGFWFKAAIAGSALYFFCKFRSS